MSRYVAPLGFTLAAVCVAIASCSPAAVTDCRPPAAGADRCRPVPPAAALTAAGAPLRAFVTTRAD
ncbi:hypothetical protein NKG94_49050 [Micromonospora sp. M12]